MQSSMRFWSLGSRSVNFLPLRSGRSGSRKSQSVGYEVPECRQALQAVYDYHPPFLILRQVEDRQRNSHEHGFDELALLVLRPDEITLEIRVHYVSAFVDPPDNVENSSCFMPDQKRINGVIPPRAALSVQSFNILSHQQGYLIAALPWSFLPENF